jgi:predicted nucleic acid-binding protein
VRVVVSDTTPLNYLILIGNVDVLPRLFDKVLIPPAVLREISHPDTPPPVAAWAGNLPEWVEVKSPLTVLPLGIDRGESEAISLAFELGIAVLMDEHAGRAAAEQQSVLVLGTLAILNIADTKGWLEFEPAVARLRATNFRCSETVLEKVRAIVRARKQTQSDSKSSAQDQIEL